MATGSVGNDNRYSQLPDLLRRAVVAHEQGRLDEAFPLYRRFLDEHPRHATALQLLGLLHSQRGELDAAIARMRESLAIFPDQAEVANNLGNALSRAGRLEEAIASYTEALRILPNYVDAQRNLGLSFLQADRQAEAASCFERCIELRPDDATAWLSLGNVRQQEGDLDRAIDCLRKALELRPDYAEAHHNLGMCLRARHRPEQALPHYQAALSLGLDRAELYHNLGNAYIDTQRSDEAIDAYREAVKRDPGNLDTHRNLNALLWQQEQLDDYLQSYRDALAEQPGAVELRLAYAVALNQQARHEEAERVLAQGIRHARHSSELKSQLAYTLEQQERWTDALQMHAAAIEMPDSLPNHRISYARALLACRRPDEALQHAQTGAVQMPFNQRALAYLGLCWRMLDDERDALLNDYSRFVRVYDLPVPRGFSDTAEFNERLRAVLEPLHIAKQHPAEQTLRGGSQTSGDLFDRRDAEIQHLIAGLNLCIQDYIAGLPDNREHPLFARRTEHFDYAASWSVRLGRCGYHTMHVHPLGWISSAYYVEVPSEVSESEEHGGGIKFGEPDIDLGEQGDARRLIQPAVGKLVLFPSYMWHGTVPFESDDPRMTVAFDVVPGGR